MHVERLYRFPVKGLNAETLTGIDVTPGSALPWDRAFALAQGDSGFDPAAPAFRPKSNFMCLLKNASIAGLTATFDPAQPRLTIRAPNGTSIAANPLDPTGRLDLATFLTAFLGDEARGTPIFHHVPGHVFGDDRQPVVSLMSLSTLAAYEHDIGAPRDEMRFRSNILLADAPPWAEFDWIDRHLTIGTATFRVLKRTRRCNATQVNPATSARDADPVRELMHTYGHPDLGILLEVLQPGHLTPGAPVTIA